MVEFSDTIKKQWPPPIILPAVKTCIWISASGKVEEISLQQGSQRSQKTVPLVCHGRATARRLKCERFKSLDVLELFAFVRPAQFCLPTPRGLCENLKLELPTDQTSAALSIRYAAETLLDELKAETRKILTLSIARVMDNSGWPWATIVLETLDADDVRMHTPEQQRNLKKLY